VTDFEAGVERVVAQIVDDLAAASPDAVRVTMRIEAGDPEPGHWCDRCLLPSAAEFPLHGLHRHGVMELGRVRVCPDCGHIERVS
jgi:hypothetical protein